MSEVPVIDVVMPFWGDVEHLRIAVRSVLAQDDVGWRLVVIDDHYPGTAHLEFLRSLDDARVTISINATNLGVAGNFQRAVMLAESPFCVIMGCDDVMLPGYLTRVRALFEAFPEASYVQPGVTVIDDAGRVVAPLADRVKRVYRPRGGGMQALRGPNLAASLLRGNWTYFPALCWRTEVLKRHGFRREFDVVLDLALQFEIAADGGTFAFDDVVAFQYRRHLSSVSSARAVDGRRFAEESAFFAEAARRSSGPDWTSARRAARWHLSSRLHAASLLPRALRARDGRSSRALLCSMFGWPHLPR